MPTGAWTICLVALLTIHAAPPGLRTNRHHDPVIQRALAIVGEPLNPVVVVDIERARQMYARTPGAGGLSPRVNAFRAPGNRGDPRIYLLSQSVVYRRAARSPTVLDMLKLAATLVHEQIHAEDGDAAAYRLQADFVRSRLHSLPGAQREPGRRYLEALEARAVGLAPERLRLSLR